MLITCSDITDWIGSLHDSEARVDRIITRGKEDDIAVQTEVTEDRDALEEEIDYMEG